MCIKSDPFIVNRSKINHLKMLSDLLSHLIKVLQLNKENALLLNRLYSFNRPFFFLCWVVKLWVDKNVPLLAHWFHEVHSFTHDGHDPIYQSNIPRFPTIYRIFRKTPILIYYQRKMLVILKFKRTLISTCFTLQVKIYIVSLHFKLIKLKYTLSIYIFKPI